MQAEEKIVYLLFTFNLNSVDGKHLVADLEPAVLVTRGEVQYARSVNARSEWRAKIVRGIRLNVDNKCNKCKLRNQSPTQ